MKVTVKRGGGIPFARKESYEYEGVKYEADIKDLDIVRILDSGNVELGKWGDQKNFKIKTRNGEKKLAFNQATINVLAEEFGDETEEWVGKDVVVLIDKKMIAGQKCVVPYLVTEGWSLDDFGELVKEGQRTEVSVDEIDTTEIPFD